MYLTPYLLSHDNNKLSNGEYSVYLVWNVTIKKWVSWIIITFWEICILDHAIVYQCTRPWRQRTCSLLGPWEFVLTEFLSTVHLIIQQPPLGSIFEQNHCHTMLLFRYLKYFPFLFITNKSFPILCWQYLA